MEERLCTTQSFRERQMKALPSSIFNLQSRVVLILIHSLQTEEENKGRANVAGIYRQSLRVVGISYTHTNCKGGWEM